MDFNAAFFISIFFTVLLLLAGHYFTWGIKFLARNEVAARFYSYIYGLLSIMAGMSVLASITNRPEHWRAVGEVALFSVAGGIATAAFYGVDWVGVWVTQTLREKKLQRAMLDGEKLEVKRVGEAQVD